MLLRYSRYAIFFALLSLWVGCGSSAESDNSREASSENKPPLAKNIPSKNQAASSKTSTPPKEAKKPKPVIAESPTPQPAAHEKPSPKQKPNFASLGDLLKQPADSMARHVSDSKRMKVDDAKAAAEGIRKIAGKRLTLYTDVEGEEIDRLPAIFDLAFPQYCEYFHIRPESLGDWHATGFLMKDKERFVRADLFPAALPDFKNGFSWNYDLWVFDQTSDYYRRHLLIHEGVHCFMNTVLGGCGAPWYMEGMAEMLGTHDWRDGKLMLNYFPQSSEEVPGWGRVRLIHDAVAANHALPLDKILKFPGSLHFTNDYYAWCWAAAIFLDEHPRYQKRFRELYKDVLHPDFNTDFYQAFAKDLPELCEEWQVFIAGLEYGYDIPRTVIDFTPGKAISASSENAEPTTVRVASDRGWQNSGIRLEGGRKYEITASGQWHKKCRPAFWSGLKNLPGEIALGPNGVSIRYYHGQPLGILQATILPDHFEGPDPVFWNPNLVLPNPTPIGLRDIFAPDQSGTLFFKLNDTAADLSSNQGEVKVEIRQP